MSVHACCPPPELGRPDVASPDSVDSDRLPVVVVGAGPVGLAAAARLARSEEPTVVLEAGSGPGASVREWGHVRLFSPWELCIDPVAGRTLEAAGWAPPPAEALPTGDELVERYLEPLSRLPGLRRSIRYGHRVTDVTRVGRDRLKGRNDRSEVPFLVRYEADGARGELRARAVIDASGTWTQPRPLGAHGLPALGERQTKDRIHYGLPDVLGADRDRYAGRRTAVVGAGHSAANVLLDLGRLGSEAPDTEPVWILRGGRPDRVFQAESDAEDQLEARGALERRLREQVEAGAIRVITRFGTRAVEERDGAVALVDGSGRTVEADSIVGVTGFRPDLSMLDELRLDLDPLTQAPRNLGPLIDPNVHTCGTVPAHGEDVLRHPEPNFYLVGMKSYGRAPTFLLPTGYEQVRSVVAALSGDHEAIRSEKLDAAEPGVCSTDAALEADEMEVCRV